MKITRYEHATVVLSEGDSAMVIDPGELSNAFDPATHAEIRAVVITHVHADHLDPAVVEEIRSLHPDVDIYSTPQVAARYPELSIIGVTAGDVAEAGPFMLEFVGQKHIPVHSSREPDENIGVIVNASLYYPGDSLEVPDADIKTLLVPISGPWLKTGEAMDFVEAIEPTLVIPTHDGLLSEDGIMFTDNWVRQAAERAGASYQRLTIGETITI